MDLPEYNSDEDENTDEELSLEEMTAEEINQKLSNIYK